MSWSKWIRNIWIRFPCKCIRVEKLRRKKRFTLSKYVKPSLGNLSNPQTPPHGCTTCWQSPGLPLHSLCVLLTNLSLSSAGIYNYNISFSRILKNVDRRHLTHLSWIWCVLRKKNKNIARNCVIIQINIIQWTKYTAYNNLYRTSCN